MSTTPRRARIRRSTIAYAVLFCLAVVFYFALRPDPSGAARNPPLRTDRVTTTTVIIP